MYRIWSNNTKRFLFPNLKANTYEELKEMFVGRLYTITLDRVSYDHELKDGIPSPRKVKEEADAMSFEAMMKYCDFEIRNTEPEVVKVSEVEEKKEVYKTCKYCGEYYKSMCYCWRDETL